jgi:hypothetical protein
MNFTAHTDPGHGWIAVPVKLLSNLGLIDKISTCSFLRGKTAYLEEDSDALKFINAFRAANGQDPTFSENNTDKRSPIRSYGRYCAKQALATLGI